MPSVWQTCLKTRKQKKNESILTLPSGEKRIVPQCEYDKSIKNKISTVIDSWYKEFNCAEDQLAFMVLDSIYEIEKSTDDSDEN